MSICSVEDAHKSLLELFDKTAGSGSMNNEEIRQFIRPAIHELREVLDVLKSIPILEMIKEKLNQKPDD